MKLGIMAYASPTGLGIQTNDYYRFLKPAKTLLVDLSPLNHLPIDIEKFTTNQIGEVQIVKGLPQSYEVDSFCKDLDVILIAETPLNPYLFNKARAMGIKTVLHYNFEFLDYLANPDLPKPDVLLAPTLWHWSEMQHYAHDWGVQLVHMPVAVDRSVLPYTRRTAIKSFLHIAGHTTVEDRNGTDIVHDAIKLVKSKDVTFTIRSQRPITTLPSDKRVKVIVGDVDNYYDLYNGEDCLLMPRRYGGLCLPLNEAMSLGMIPLMSNVEPQNIFLPSDCLLTANLTKILQTRTAIGVYSVTPQALAARIDRLAGMPSEDVQLLSEQMNMQAQTLSWDEQQPKYVELFQALINAPVVASPIKAERAI